MGNEATIGFLRHAEIKHGRVAMFGFVGYLVHANGIRWPWPMMLDGTPFPTGNNPPELWDKIPYNLFDPFNLSKRAGDEKKARGLEIEINNGRLAMLGLFGFLVEATIPGAVPALTGIIPSYAGQVMAPFTQNMLDPSSFQ